MNKTRADLAMEMPHPNMVTAGQIDTLLRVIATLSNSMAMQRALGLEQTEPMLPKDALMSAEASFIYACNQLDEILSDKSRWNMDFQKIIEARADQLHKGNMEFLEAQKAAALEVASPHFQLRPTLKKLPGNRGWVAFLGDIKTDPDNSILGIGVSPADAMTAFDDVFKGTLPPYMMQWLAERQAAAEANQVPPPFPSNPNNEKPVVRKRNSKSRRSSQSGQNPS